MDKEQANKFFKPASQCKRLAGEYIVWSREEQNYYVSPVNPQARVTKYHCGQVTKKQGDTLITAKFDRVSLHSAYVVSNDLASVFPKWEGSDAVLGYKAITRDELMSILETLPVPTGE